MPIISMTLPRHEVLTTLDHAFTLEGTIHNSIVLATVEQRSEVDVLTLRNAVVQDIQSFVDVACVRVGASLLVEVISARASNGDWQIFDSFIPALATPGVHEFSAELLRAAAADTQVQIALADFREAMRVPVQTGFFCYRAVEAIMQSFRTPPARQKPLAWSSLRQALNVAETATRRLEENAGWARHGEAGALTDADRLDLLSTTQKILLRYLDFVVEERRPLNLAETVN